jgi:outer membrane autotransporter protein
MSVSSGYELKNIGAVGIMNYGTAAANVLTVSAAGPITINAQVEAGTGTGTDYVNKGALAVGVLNTNGKENNNNYASGVIRINQPLTITATAKGGTASSSKRSQGTDICAGAQAWAYGLYNYAGTGTITVGQVNITATAQGGSAADPNSAGNVASASAYGAYNDGGKLNIGVENTTSTFAVTATGGTVDEGSHGYSNATAYGLGIAGNYDKGLNIKGNVHITKVKAVAGSANDAADSSIADATGMSDVYSITGNVEIDEVSAETLSSNIAVANATKNAKATGYTPYGGGSSVGGNLHIGTVKAVAGTALGKGANVNADATGVEFRGNKAGGTFTVDKVLAKAGTAADAGTAVARATGMAVSWTSTGDYKQITLTNVKAVAGTGKSAFADAVGLKFYTSSTSSCTVAGLTANVQATGPSNASDDPYASAHGFENGASEIKLIGDTALTATITNSNAAKKNEAAAVYTYAANGVTDINTTDGTTSLGKKVQLNGDVIACDSGKNNIILDGSTSYLMGNILNATAIKTTTGTNNLTFTNGATWQPVFDNRNGSFINGTDATTYSLTNKVNDITTAANLTLSNKGKIDLTWDDATRDPNVTKRTMTIASLAGDGGVLVVNSNIQQNIADEFIVTNNTATNIGIDVAYDPALAVSGLDDSSSITGKARVLTINGGTTTPTVKGVADSYNGFDYTPTITTANDGKYYVTKISATNVEPTPTPEPTPEPTPTPTPIPTPTPDPRQTLTAPSRPMREALHERMALHNLWVNAELNNLQKRMGDLRAVEPADSGIWARYEHNKLEKGSDTSLKYNYFQLGYDKDFKGATGTFYRGAAFSYGKGTGDYEVGTGDLKEGALSLYQTWIGKDGRYYDIILKGGKLMNNYDISSAVTSNPYSSDYSTWAYSISGEVGKRFKKENGFYVEPQLELSLSKIKGADFTTSTGMDVHADAQNTAIARIGVEVGKEIKNVGSYYAKASYYHDFGGGVNMIASDSTFYPYSYSEDIAKNWCIFTLGGTAKVAKNCNVFGELSKYTGQLTNNVQVNIGARWTF